MAPNEYLSGSPGLVVEVFSPANRRGLLAQKAALYLEFGAQSMWIVYPAKRTLVAHEAAGESEFREGEVVEFAGLAISIDQIFAGL